MIEASWVGSPALLGQRGGGVRNALAVTALGGTTVTLAWLLPSIPDDILITPQSSTTTMNIDTPVPGPERPGCWRTPVPAGGTRTLAGVPGGRFGHVATSIVRDNRKT
jgi:hypothetical protein